jgi:hypothetical protein
MTIPCKELREEARKAGLKRYASNHPCVRGHYCDRLVHDNRCVECKKISERTEKASNYRLEYARRWRKNNPEKSKANTRRYLLKVEHKKLKYPDPTRPMPSACECCGRTQKIALSLDHCHVTGDFRGWLCHPCNMSIGALGDNVSGLFRAVQYLEKAASK